MMDVEKVQRIGKLAKELLQHGMATDSDEALRLADSMVNKKKDFSDMQNLVLGVKPGEERAPDVSAGSFAGGDAAAISMMVKDTSAVKELQSQVGKHKDAIIELQEQMRLMVDEFNKLRTAPQRQQVILEKEKDKPQTSLKPEEVKPHPRAGGWSPGDISIEKFFYAGPPK